MESISDRTELLIGSESIEKIKNLKVLIFGVGGVGSYVVETLCRLGVGKIGICDKDKVSISNINRQIPALHSTVGMAKVDVMEKRMKDINPDIIVEKYEFFYGEDSSCDIELKEYDYIVDAIDSIKSKLFLIKKADEYGIRIISSMGAGNKFNPGGFMVDDIYNTQVDPIAKIMRRELKKMGIKSLKVVYSRENPVGNDSGVIGSMPFVPGACGLVIAGEVFKELVLEKE